MIDASGVKRRCSQCLLISAVIGAISLSGLILFQRAATSLAETLLAPWFTICEMVTPIEWQTAGNALLGVTWLIPGVVASSLCIGAVCAVGMATIDRLRKASH